MCFISNLYFSLNQSANQIFFSSVEGWSSVPLVSFQIPSFSAYFWCSSWGRSLLFARRLAVINHSDNHSTARAFTRAVDTVRKNRVSFWSSQILERRSVRWRETRLLSTPVSSTSINNPRTARTLSFWTLNSSGQKKTTTVWIQARFVFLLVCNIFGLVPFFEAVTGKAGFTLGRSFAIWAAVTLLGIQRQGIKVVKLFLPSGPSWPMAPVFVRRERISYCFRARSRGTRLWANMMAGHQLIHLVTGICLVPALCLPLAMGAFVTALGAGLLMARTGLEAMVCLRQSGVFCLLTGFYRHEVLSKKDSLAPKTI